MLLLESPQALHAMHPEAPVQGCRELRCYWPNFYYDVAVGTLEPDVVVGWRLDDYRRGADTVLERALALTRAASPPPPRDPVQSLANCRAVPGNPYGATGQDLHCYARAGPVRPHVSQAWVLHQAFVR